LCPFQVKPPPPLADWEPILDDELNRLADKFRLPLVLCDLEGQPCKQVALQLKIPVGTLFSRLNRARRTLAQRLRWRGITDSGGAIATMFDGNAVLANVPLPPASSTVKAATAVAAVGTATLLVSAKVTSLAQGVLKAMFLNKLTTVSAVFLVVACIAGGASTLVSHAVGVDASAQGPRSLVM
jgi:Sigma-70, region 4